jgi:hypothetical protein
MVDEVLDRYRRAPRPAPRPDDPFRLRTTLDDPAPSHEILEAWRQPGEPPSELVDLWASARRGRLFEDIDYGQLGLVLLSPHESGERTAVERHARSEDFQPDDVVIGEFLGDQELVVYAPSGSGDRRILIALPLDHRSGWFGAADSLSRFLDRYFERGGDKYWEPQHRGQKA